MIKVGLTGGIGSGKSTVASVFSILGIPVFDCDTTGNSLLIKDCSVISAVKKLLGEESYHDGIPDKKYIASKIFTDHSLLSGINSIIHPAVLKQYNKWIKENNGNPYTVMESAILFESGFNNAVDVVITVSAPERLRMERVVIRDKVDIENVRRRIEAQMRDAERDKYAYATIIADESQLVVPQILELHRKLIFLDSII